MTIEWAESNPAQLIRRANLASMGRRVPQNDKWKPTLAWCKSMVLAQDSTLEFAHLIIDDDIRGDVSNQIVRATAYHPRHVCESWREDWRHGKPRPMPAEKRVYVGLWDIKALINFSRERLCYRAMKETREEAEAIKLYLMRSGDVLMQAVGWALVNDCVYRYDCSFDKRSCGWFHDEKRSPDIRVCSLYDRYDSYNAWFEKVHP